jgi:hypothetical protein
VAHCADVFCGSFDLDGLLGTLAEVVADVVEGFFVVEGDGLEREEMIKN